MNWKTLTLVLLLFGVSSQASAATVYTNPNEGGTYLSLEAAGRAYVAYLGGDSCKQSGTYYYQYYFDSATSSGFTYNSYKYSKPECRSFQRKSTLSIKPQASQSCPDGTTPNEATQKCEDSAPEECPAGYIRNEVGLCVLPPEDDFCDGDEFADMLMQEVSSCAALYPDHFTNLVPSCTDRNNYSFDCKQGFPKPTDPTDPIDSPSGDFGGGTTPPSNPNTTEFDKPEPDEVTPNDTTDTALMEAVRNLNRDNNQALMGLNDDLNVGLDKLDGQLVKLNDTNKEIGDKLVEQTKQDKAFYEANKKLALQQTGAISKVGSDIVGALNGQTQALTDALDNLGENDKSLSTSGCSQFTCNGDAIACYIARQSWKNECAEDINKDHFKNESSALIGDIQTVAQGSVDSEGAFKGVFADATSTADEALDAYTSSNGFSFDGGCPAPRTFSVLGNPWTIDYTAFCQLALVFRFFIMASAALSSFFMIAKYI